APRKRLGASRKSFGASPERLGASREKVGASREKLRASPIRFGPPGFRRNRRSRPEGGFRAPSPPPLLALPFLGADTRPLPPCPAPPSSRWPSPSPPPSSRRLPAPRPSSTWTPTPRRAATGPRGRRR